MCSPLLCETLVCTDRVVEKEHAEPLASTILSKLRALIESQMECEKKSKGRVSNSMTQGSIMFLH